MTRNDAELVPLYGVDGNVYAISGRVGRALKRAGYRPAADGQVRAAAGAARRVARPTGAG